MYVCKAKTNISYFFSVFFVHLPLWILLIDEHGNEAMLAIKCNVNSVFVPFGKCTDYCILASITVKKKYLEEVQMFTL